MRNPFSVEDVPDPVGPDVEAFAATIPAGDPALDENAIAWVIVATAADGLGGAWSSRWRAGTAEWQQGVATVQVVGDRLYILYRDSGTYLIEAERRGDRLVGRYANLKNPKDTSPWVGTIVDDYRIDGHWSGGRWDLRRCSPDELPEPIIAGLLTEARQLPAAELRELLGFARYLRWRRNS
jgi:hypothetical protein